MSSIRLRFLEILFYILCRDGGMVDKIALQFKIINIFVGEWWNGRHARLKIWYSQGCGGSSPPLPTKIFIIFARARRITTPQANKIWCRKRFGGENCQWQFARRLSDANWFRNREIAGSQDVTESPLAHQNMQNLR